MPGMERWNFWGGVGSTAMEFGRERNSVRIAACRCVGFLRRIKGSSMTHPLGDF